MVTIIVETQLQDIFIPNVFSPNGDNNNDFFTIEGDGMTNFSIKIFNRWGELIFESDDQNVSWNGNHSGKSASKGVFAYTLTYNDNSGTPQVVSGNITVIK
jgi:gliding motility-associated-like protein